MAETLTAYQARITAEESEHDAYVQWCDEQGLDPDEDHRESFRVELTDQLEEHLESVAESRRDDYDVDHDVDGGYGW